MEMMIFVPAVAVVLDLVIGDPQGIPHPVRFIGTVLDSLEGCAGKMENGQKLTGIMLTGLVTVAVMLIAYVAVSIPFLGVLLALYLAYAGLSLGQLLREAKGVEALLTKGDKEAARAKLATLVSRDVDGLDESAMRKTLAETVSENLNDGFVAPLFWLLVGGPAFMWGYKAVSTMDSMWGYKTEQYKNLGWAAAKLDDILAWIPARLTALFLGIAGALSGKGGENLSQNIMADAGKTASPNAGWPMSAAAWLIGSPMGGRARYHGMDVDKPVLGPADGPAWNAESIGSLLCLVKTAGLVTAGACYLYYLMVSLAI